MEGSCFDAPAGRRLWTHSGTAPPRVRGDGDGDGDGQFSEPLPLGGAMVSLFVPA